MAHVAGTVSLMMAYLGDQPCVFAAMDGEGPMTLDQLAKKTGLNAKYLRDWLGSVSAAGDPVGVARRVRKALKDDGVFMVVEPMAGDSMAENMHLMGQIFYGFSCMACVPVRLAQPVGYGLDAQAGQAKLAQVLGEGGFTSVRRAAETPSNMVLKAKP